MHPRNIYNAPPNFTELAKNFPDFKRNTALDLKGRVHFNFKNADALKALSKTLLKKDFNLIVEFPPNTLVPTIPLRLNYILFIEDLLNLANMHENIKGLDIGTGASCIYPLIVARKNNWSMVGTDINSDSIKYAKQNVAINKLEHLINVEQVNESNVIHEILRRDNVRYDFCMCNPPFFGNVNELCSQLKRKPNKSPKNAFTAAYHEVLTEGGELEFVSKMIDESCSFHDRIRIFTSMLGIKRSIKPLMIKLKKISQIKSFVFTEFYQGNTTRFGVAWTFDETINLLKVPTYTKKTDKKQNKVYLYNIRPFNRSIEEVYEKLKEIFDELQITYGLVEKLQNTILFNITAYADTWSHNRRKRRKIEHYSQSKLQLSEIWEGSDNTLFNSTELSNVRYDTTVNSESANTNMNESNLLKRKIKNFNHNDIKKPKIIKNEQQSNYLESTVSVELLNLELLIKVNFISGPGGKDASHQILQFIKNHLKFV